MPTPITPTAGRRAVTAAQAVLERDFQRTLTDALDTFRWSWSHTFPLRTKHGWRTGTTAVGWPDLVCLRDDTIVAIEVKGDHGILTPEQRCWLVKFSLVPSARAWVLRPSDDWPTIVSMMRYPGQAPSVFGWA